MKRKKPLVLPVQSLERSIAGEKPLSAVSKTGKRAKCVICGGVAAPFSAEALCWVCRRLKISAWRESENQPSIQE